MMLERSAETGRRLQRLLEQGCAVYIRRTDALVVVRVSRGNQPSSWYDGGTLDACVAQIEIAA